MKSPSSLYELLQVDPGADAAVIHAAYRALMKRHHPDRGGSGAEAQRLNSAYQTLANPVSRRAYDLLRRQAAIERRRAPRREVLTGGSLLADLRSPLLTRFRPVDLRGPVWLFDFVGHLRQSRADRVFVQGFTRGDEADAESFRIRIEAARLLRPLFDWGADVFVAVVPRITRPFEAQLRGPRTLFRLGASAVVLIDLSAQRLHATASAARLRAVEALASVVPTRAAASA